ncbi:MAG: hypothetical protein U0175_37015 [Caldilineaceae bacterium]
MTLRFRLEIPQHGWLPIHLQCEEYDFSFTVSDVQGDSIGMLIKSISDAVDGIDSVTDWYLEPDIYRFEFRCEREKIEFQVAALRYGNTKFIHKISGTRQEIILPFWRAVKAFSTQNWHESDWRYYFPTDKMKLLDYKIEAFKLTSNE